MMMKKIKTAILMSTMMVFAIADSRVPRTSKRQHSVTSTMAGRLKMPPSPGAAMMVSGSRKPNTLGEQLVEVLRPSDGDGRRRNPVLQQQTSRHAERRDLAQRGVGVRVGRSGDGDGRGKLRVANGSEGGRDAGQHEREDDCGPASGTASVKTIKMPVPMVAPTPNKRQLEQAYRPLELTTLRIWPRLGDEGLDRLLPE